MRGREGQSRLLVRQRLGVQLRSLREARQLTQEHLAFEAGVSQGSISNYETGRHDIPLSLLVELCRKLEANPGDLLRHAYEFESAS